MVILGDTQQAKVPTALVLDFDKLDCPPWEDEVKSQNVMGDRLVEIAYTEFPCD